MASVLAFTMSLVWKRAEGFPDSIIRLQMSEFVLDITEKWTASIDVSGPVCPLGTVLMDVQLELLNLTSKTR